ncbi:hypothetical protein SVIO_104600 [Streptomyces violaceusniger]|uniref:ABC transporter domain-containing protein n=2 Tax=Streptomyces violaceusniger TaxID=68280 RepID=A0A4D4LNJ1_STRVO|nr:hypothetical protein SVIO_104600 [Streptomyces violaceusniger]
MWRAFSIVGESGSGKSTTARILTGLTRATAGQVSLLGTEVGTLDTKAFRPLRRDVQIVFQNPYASFDPRFDVRHTPDHEVRAAGATAAVAQAQYLAIESALKSGEPLFDVGGGSATDRARC